jgi:hypothetical protein
MPAKGRGPDLRQAGKVTRPRRLADGPATPLERVRKLQSALHAKAKAEPAFRFYALWDKVCRADVLEEAYRACRRNGGAPQICGRRRASETSRDCADEPYEWDEVRRPGSAPRFEMAFGTSRISRQPVSTLHNERMSANVRLRTPPVALFII